VSPIRRHLTGRRPYRSAVTGAIVGVRSAQQVDGAIGAAGIELNSNDLLEIEQTMGLQAA